MKIKYLGTGASEGIPSLYCKCNACENARRKKGKELRTRTGFVFDDKILIDFSADSYSNFIKHDVDMTQMEHVLISHTHEDHYCPYDLTVHYPLFSEGVVKMIHVYGNPFVKKLFYSLDFWSEGMMRFITLHTLTKEETVDIGGYAVTPFYTDHMRREDCFVYLIQKDGKAYLHLVDSSEPSDRVYDFLVKNGVKLDAVTMDCTFASLKNNFYGHMNIWQNIHVKDKLYSLGAAKDGAIFVCTHISHFSKEDTHETLSAIAEKNGMLVAYDGMVLEF